MIVNCQKNNRLSALALQTIVAINNLDLYGFSTKMNQMGSKNKLLRNVFELVDMCTIEGHSLNGKLIVKCIIVVSGTLSAMEHFIHNNLFIQS